MGVAWSVDRLIALTNGPFRVAGKGEKKQYENNLRFVGDFGSVRSSRSRCV
jgi:hypothetical protein